MIKKLSKKNKEEILKLKKKSEYKIIRKYDTRYDESEEKEYILNTLKNGIILGYFEGKKLIGTGGLFFFKHNDAEIRHMYVNPEFQRKGIGKQIMKELEKYAKKNKIKKLKLNVFHKSPAVKFYDKMGYKIRAYRMQKISK